MCRNWGRGADGAKILKLNQRSRHQSFIKKNLEKTILENGLRKQDWIRESITYGEGISTPQRPF